MLLWCHSFPLILESNPFHSHEKSDEGVFSCSLLKLFAMYWASLGGVGGRCIGPQITE